MQTRRKTFLAEWREYRKMTQSQAAELTNMSASNLSMLENGRQGYTQKTLEKLADVYNCRPADLLLFNPLTDPDGFEEAWNRIHFELDRKHG